MPINCNNCRKELQNRDIRICPECGSLACGSCYDKNGGVCENCAADMRYLQ